MAGIDTSIYSQYLRPPKSVADYDREARGAEMDQLQLLTAKDNRAASQRAAQRQDQLQQLMRGMPGASDLDRLSALRDEAFFDEAGKLEGSMLDREKTRATVAKDTADAKGKDYDLQRKRYEHTVGGLSQFKTAEDARQWLADSVVNGHMDMKQATTMMSKVPQDPAEFGKWREGAVMSLMDAGKQAGFITPDANAKLTATTSTANTAANNARAAAEGAANRAVTMRGQDQRLALGREAGVRAEKKATAGGKGGAVSATLQKELIESDDMADTARNTIGTLEQALKINGKAYSGFGAKERARVRSNLFGESPEADATIEMDNLIGSQALSGMKAIFGGNPTEGERSILLDLQASADKTPEQRKAIIERGIAAASKRLKLSADRARSIRSGTYLTEGPGGSGDEDEVAAALRIYGGD